MVVMTEEFPGLLGRGIGGDGVVDRSLSAKGVFSLLP
jgi:hypothetical protein